MSLLEETLSLMAENRRPVAEVCADAGVSVRWWYELREGKKDPGIRKVQRLHDVLQSKQKAA